MKIKKVTRYYCEFCSRGAFKKTTMFKHERGCTKNPDRVCSLCLLAGNDQHPVSLLADTLLQLGLKELRELTTSCPCCILTAYRAVYKASGNNPEDWHDLPAFDFRAELKAWWDDYHEGQSYYV